VDGLKRLEAEYRGADETLLRLVAFAVARSSAAGPSRLNGPRRLMTR
jgi:hypothetical protein